MDSVNNDFTCDCPRNSTASADATPVCECSKTHGFKKAISCDGTATAKTGHFEGAHKCVCTCGGFNDATANTIMEPDNAATVT